MEKLKPCPFCGSEVEIWNKSFNYDNDVKIEIINFKTENSIIAKHSKLMIKKTLDFRYKEICSDCYFSQTKNFINKEMCSKCNFTEITDFIQDNEIINFNYCPRCGAKMYSEE